MVTSNAHMSTPPERQSRGILERLAGFCLQLARRTREHVMAGHGRPDSGNGAGAPDGSRRKGGVSGSDDGANRRVGGSPDTDMGARILMARKLIPSARYFIEAMHGHCGLTGNRTLLLGRMWLDAMALMEPDEALRRLLCRVLPGHDGSAAGTAEFLGLLIDGGADIAPGNAASRQPSPDPDLARGERIVARWFVRFFLSEIVGLEEYSRRARRIRRRMAGRERAGGLADIRTRPAGGRWLHSCSPHRHGRRGTALPRRPDVRSGMHGRGIGGRGPPPGSPGAFSRASPHVSFRRVPARPATSRIQFSYT